MSERTPKRNAVMRAAGEYWVQVCKNCRHPGGAHRIEQWEPRIESCPCGQCPAFVLGDWATWSDRRARELLGEYRDTG